jgi:AcrR family transcriptional regulator
MARLLEVATQIFIDQGYAHTQMADVAQALGVAKGTLYLYVESKEALFDFVARHADLEEPPPPPPSLPIPTPRSGATLRFVRDRILKRQTIPALAAAVERRSTRQPRQELEAILGELYDLLFRNRRGIKLLDRSARDHPELAALWFDGARDPLIELLTRYLEIRMKQGAFRSYPDVSIAARLTLETIALWAIHRHWDPRPQPVHEATARETAIQFVVGALAKE